MTHPQRNAFGGDLAVVRLTDSDGSEIRCYTRQDAAKLLSISVRTLYERTQPRGPIAPVLVGRRIVYSAAELQRYIASGGGTRRIDNRRADGSSDDNRTTDRTGGDR